MSIEKEALEFCENIKEQYFQREGPKEFHKTSIGVQEELSVLVLSDTLCLVYGIVNVKSKNKAEGEYPFHITVLSEKTVDGMKLLHCSFLKADNAQMSKGSVEKDIKNKNEEETKKLKKKIRQLENLNQNIPGAAHQCAFDNNFTLIDMSDSFLTLLGYSRREIKELFHNQYINMIVPADRVNIIGEIFEQLKSSNIAETQYRVLCKNKEPIWVLDKTRYLVDEEGNKSLYCIIIDITDQKKEKEQLRLSLERHKVIMDQATDIVFDWDITSDTLLVSPNWKKKFGYEPIKQQISEKIYHSENIHPEDIEIFAEFLQETSAGIKLLEKEFRIRNAEDQFIWCRLRSSTQFDSNKHPIKAVGVIIDISAERKEKQELLNMAQRDALTGLFNKSTIKAHVEQKINSSEEELQAMFIIDIDNFKNINSVFGHLCGDTLLYDVANVLKQNFRSTDLIGRIGGDEFLVYMPEVVDRESAELKAEKIFQELNKLKPQKKNISVSCSIGAVLSYQGTADYFSMYQCADQALYYQKRNGKNGVTFYSSQTCNMEESCELVQTAVGAAIVSDDLGAVEEKLAQYTFRMLNQSSDLRTSIYQLLEIVGNTYDVSRVYIFENAEDGKTCSNTYEWCAPGITAERDKLQNLSFAEELGDYIDNFDDNGIFYCHDIKNLNADLHKVLEPQGICSLLQCAVLDGGKFRGFVGFDECGESRYWTKQQIATLTLISNVLAVFLTKLRLEEQINRLTIPD